ncbi:MAG: hypothetical protein ACYCO9_16400 [Streptosporangiaceae bacterium]
MSEERARRLEAYVRLLIGVLSLAATAWYLTPEDQRRLMAMRLAEGSRRLFGRAALRAGRESMSRELQTGREAYTVPYLLARLRDRAAEVYERLRGA